MLSTLVERSKHSVSVKLQTGLCRQSTSLAEAAPRAIGAPLVDRLLRQSQELGAKLKTQVEDNQKKVDDALRHVYGWVCDSSSAMFGLMQSLRRHERGCTERSGGYHGTIGKGAVAT